MDKVQNLCHQKPKTRLNKKTKLQGIFSRNAHTDCNGHPAVLPYFDMNQGVLLRRLLDLVHRRTPHCSSEGLDRPRSPPGKASTTTAIDRGTGGHTQRMHTSHCTPASHRDPLLAWSYSDMNREASPCHRQDPERRLSFCHRSDHNQNLRNCEVGRKGHWGIPHTHRTLRRTHPARRCRLHRGMAGIGHSTCQRADRRMRRCMGVDCDPAEAAHDSGQKRNRRSTAVHVSQGPRESSLAHTNPFANFHEPASVQPSVTLCESPPTNTFLVLLPISVCSPPRGTASFTST
eukprot:c19240_g1_i7.p1 GENE.c19240_g1_i7~~c19240_g1_i7.p1  ORF type:complete len:289 (+),score=-38.72 c19240_g1_i7:2-868(+)